MAPRPRKATERTQQPAEAGGTDDVVVRMGSRSVGSWQKNTDVTVDSATAEMLVSKGYATLPTAEPVAEPVAEAADEGGASEGEGGEGA